ncbi:hypothetical protein [Nonomuraea sp. NPDC048826]|uniref:hypothetical protein n=1 Tax=Nonomuraea sp. NPDC048826 TaxID=3364347 RepID=UPI00371E2918
MSALWRLWVAVAAVLAAAWLVGGAAGPVEFLRPAAVPSDDPDPPPLTEAAPLRDPVRYSYAPPCDHVTGDCPQRVLVTTTGQRRRLDGARADEPFALSADGTRAVHPAGGRFVVRDLATGAVTRLPVKAGGEPLLSPDGRHLLVQDGRRPVLVDVARGTASRLPRGGRAAGWTGRGLALVTERPTGDRPGHPTEAAYVIRGPGGVAVRRFTLPGNLTDGLPSPSARTLATLAGEIRPDAVVTTGIALTDLRTGRTLRTVVPKLPDGLRAEEILRWENEEALLVRSENRYVQDFYHVVDLATGEARDAGVTVPAFAEFPVAEADAALVIGAVR